MEKLSRRDFIKSGFCAATGLCVMSLLGGGLTKDIFAAPAINDADIDVKGVDKSRGFIKNARWWEQVKSGPDVRCGLCPKGCLVSPGSRGVCGVRENQDGAYKTLVYGRPVSMHVDPIEKKPLFHFLPTSKALSLATAGCNIECKFCQNWQISQARPEDIRSEFTSPDRIIKTAVKSKIPCIAYTYSEPTIFSEYMYDIAKAGNEKGLRSVMISNGFINEKPMRELCSVLSGVKIDLKAFTDQFYRETCSGRLQPVLNTLKVLKDEDIWFEIVVLIIPTLNDSEKEIREMCQWIVKNLGTGVPLHFTRFHPTYKLTNLPRTPVKTMERCHAIAKAEGVNYAYLGNVWNHKLENTFCPKCNALLIRRQGYYTKIEGMKNSQCEKCGETIPGVWK